VLTEVLIDVLFLYTTSLSFRLRPPPSTLINLTYNPRHGLALSEQPGLNMHRPRRSEQANRPVRLLLDAYPHPRILGIHLSLVHPITSHPRMEYQIVPSTGHGRPAFACNSFQPSKFPVSNVTIPACTIIQTLCRTSTLVHASAAAAKRSPCVR
jgi:hypothetical protein